MENKQSIILYSDANFLALNILDELLKNNYIVCVITADKKKWARAAAHQTANPNLLIRDRSNYVNLKNFSYALFCGGFIKKDSAVIDFKRFISNKNFRDAKTLAVFPLDAYKLVSNSNIRVKEKSGIVFVGDLFGEGINLNSDLLIPKLINQVINKKSLTLGIGDLFYPVSVHEVGRRIVSSMSSSDLYKKTAFLLGDRVTSLDFRKYNYKCFPNLKVVYDTKIKTRDLPRENQTIWLDSNPGNLIKNTYLSLSKPKEVKTEIPKKSKPKFKYLRYLFFVIFLVLIFPFITIITSSGLLYLSYREFMNEKIQYSLSTANLAKKLFVFGNKESNLLKNIPILGSVYKESYYITSVGEKTADIFISFVPVASQVENLVDTILGDESYDIKNTANYLKNEIDYIYQQISYIEIETENGVDENTLSAVQIANLINFDKAKKFLQEGSILSNYLPLILGADKNKSYLALFQNNMELRPTGGFIGSYGILDFGGGKLNGLTVNDIYSADGQLKGHIDPPEPIRKYLGEANWFFRDSNWDPDFTVSAARAEWFLNKEMGQQVDGVIAIDLNPIKNILNYTGPIFLPDYNLTISSDNLYERTQQESQANFFAGSRKKASFLTALSRVLISEISKLNTEKRIGIVRSLYEGLETRGIQMHFDDINVQESIDKLSWSGGLPTYSCGDGCYSDFISEVEANVGVNKSNYFISRKFNLDLSVKNNVIKRNLGVKLNNSANPSLGPSGIYKTYLRIIIPGDADFLSANVDSGQNPKIIEYDRTEMGDRQEIGIYLEVLPGEVKNIELSWSSSVQQGSKMNGYGLFVRKQAGTEADPINIRLSSDHVVKSSRPLFTLTDQGDYLYNTTLSKDFFTRASFE